MMKKYKPLIIIVLLYALFWTWIIVDALRKQDTNEVYYVHDEEE